MAERRLPFTVRDDEGVSHRGEIVIVRSWRPDLQPDPDAAFTIVLAHQPCAGGAPAPADPRIAVCLPSAAVRLPTIAAEPAAVYDGQPPAPPMRLSLTAIDAYAKGLLLTSRPLILTPHEIFQNSDRALQLGRLANELLAEAERERRCWRDLAAILCFPDDPPKQPKPDWVRSRLARLLAQVPAAPSSDTQRAAIERLRAVEAGRSLASAARPIAQLVEDAALLRCVLDHRSAATELSSMLAYLDGAQPPDTDAELATDPAFTREQLSFITLLEQPHQLDRLRASFQVFRQRYARVYVQHHDQYWRAAARLQGELQEAAPVARTLARLNALRQLGRPVGEAQLAVYQRLLGGRPACAVRGLPDALRERPACPQCGISLRDGVPAQEGRAVLRGLQSALTRQQSRLASEAVRRILGRGGERLEQFLRVVQAADLTALASILDDDLLDFLRELLAEPVVPTPEALDLFEELARAHPVITEEQLDAVLGTLRRLLLDQLAAQRRANGGALRLATEPPA